MQWILDKAGIATNAQTESFNISFWAGLLSGTVYSIFVGIIVGLIIFFVQKNFEKRLERKKCEREFDIFKEKLYYAVHSPESIKFGPSTEGYLPKNVKDAIELINNSPVIYWSNYMKTDIILELIKYIIVSYDKYHMVSKQFDENLKNALREIYKGSINSDIESEIHLCLINNIDKNLAKTWVEQSCDINEDRFKQRIETFKLGKNVLDYKNSKDELLDDFNTLKKLLVSKREELIKEIEKYQKNKK